MRPTHGRLDLRRSSKIIHLADLVGEGRVDIWRDRCDRRSCKILVSGVNFQENNANCLTISPEKKFMVPGSITIDA